MICVPLSRAHRVVPFFITLIEFLFVCLFFFCFVSLHGYRVESEKEKERETHCPDFRVFIYPVCMCVLLIVRRLFERKERVVFFFFVYFPGER